MLITNQFVMLNFPKTGSTFTRESLKRVYEQPQLIRRFDRFGLVPPRIQELRMVPWFFSADQMAAGRSTQHGTYNQIPSKHRSKAVITVVRDPFTRIVSVYEYRDWQRHEPPAIKAIRERFPHFPDLSFAEFLDMVQINLPYTQPPGLQTEIGSLTTHFIRFYARDPLKTITSIREDTDLRKEYDLHFPKIRFLHTENLNQELYDLLTQFGLPQRKIGFILEKERMNVSKQSRSSYLDAASIDRILHQDRFFFQLFPEYIPASWQHRTP